MSEFLIELFSEEIPARMQARAAEDLSRLLTEALAAEGLALTGARAFYGPRRIALVGDLPAGTAAETREERGPRQGAPAQAVEAFLRSKVGAPLNLGDDFPARAAAALAAGETVNEGGAEIAFKDTGKGVFLLAAIARPGRATAEVLSAVIPALLWRFPWPKSMRWGGTSAFTWVRPLKRILCVYDGQVVPFSLAQGEDDGHGLTSGNETEGHRIHAPGAFTALSFSAYEAGLRERFVVLDAAERIAIIRDGIAALAAQKGVEIVPDEGLLAEVAGLVEWPVPLLGRIDDAFMDLPAELMRTTMRINQRYFALRQKDGSAAPFFALASNIAPTDGGAAVTGGNERVLRARLSDARFFWDLDRKQTLESFLPKLDTVTFHAKLGTQGERVARLVKLAEWLAPKLGAEPALAARAAKLAKADLATGLVGEFPELQGIIGRYYALKDKEDSRVAEAVAAHYRPLGPTDAVPNEPVAMAVALADKLDQLAGFFAVGEKPTGSGDPFALRRAALGVIRIIRENGLRLSLSEVFHFALTEARVSAAWVGLEKAEDIRKKLEEATGLDQPSTGVLSKLNGFRSTDLLDFIADRLRVQLRGEGLRHDVVTAALATGGVDDLALLLARAEALRTLIEGEDGANLLAAYKRATNILRIEEKRDGPHDGAVDPALLVAPEEQALAGALDKAVPAVQALLSKEEFTAAMTELAALRAPVDAFFTAVVVNDADGNRRANRLRLLAGLRRAMNLVADFAKIES
ncbi:glycine--tRNA ligase subunit beta [Acetobacteraceae bacterium H6797]|nr:glycine--tRNA ligase subunit beta [Acetobacteraceae bacterium H6797]